MEWLDYITNQLGIGHSATAAAIDASPKRLANYPTPQDVAWERTAADLGYGTGNEQFIGGQAAHVLSRLGVRTKGDPFPTKPVSAIGMDLSTATAPDLGHTITLAKNPQQAEAIAKAKDLYGQAQIAIRRSPIAQLGYDPEKINLDVKTGEKVTHGGAYDPSVDNILAMSQSPHAMVHESIHRGLKMLREKGLIPAELQKRLPDEESTVRYIMALHMGDPEKGSGSVGDAQRAMALRFFRRDEQNPQRALWDWANSPAYQGRQALEELNKIAAEHLHKTRPAGHR